ncbi:GNAT family N-acetyltransferase [Corallococcus exiguus]|uniref:GNAT family N-acetyltransferase n=1 Tax=Corallococcus exiguus TaxID=83462 RepID=UPI001471E8C2|nr:GNAT family N-acetyltransferase [Corallococcus exiguus]NNC15777.1 GNAT family N-acetyltransferase [Corallococcus exiguus]
MIVHPPARLRPARLDEIARVREIERLSARRFLGTDLAALVEDEPTDSATLAARIATGGLTVAEGEDGRPVAFLMARPVEGCGYIEQLDVLPTHAGRRLGAALISALEPAWPSLLLSTFRDVPWNAPYYARLGFRVVETLTPALEAIRAEHLARGLDESRRVFMRKDRMP